MDSDKRRKLISIVSIASFILIMAVVGVFLGKEIIELVKDPQAFRAWVDETGFISRLAFVGMVVIQVIIAVIPGEPFELAAGYAFGIFEGTLLCEIGILIGSVTVFLFVRKFGYKAVEVFFPREKIEQLSWMKDSKKLDLTAFLLFFIPGTPKDIMTYFVGLTTMSLPRWIFISFTARIPSVLTSTIAGSKLGDKDYKTAIIVFSVTLVVALVAGFLFNRLNESKQKGKE